MKTNEDVIPNWELGTARRCMRGIIGATAILAILLVPGLNEGWLFFLAIVGAYEGMTAMLNADLIFCGFYLAVNAVQKTYIKGDEDDVAIPSPLIVTGYGSQGYPNVA